MFAVAWLYLLILKCFFPLPRLHLLVPLVFSHRHPRGGLGAVSLLALGGQPSFLLDHVLWENLHLEICQTENFSEMSATTLFFFSLCRRNPTPGGNRL